MQREFRHPCHADSKKGAIRCHNRSSRTLEYRYRLVHVPACIQGDLKLQCLFNGGAVVDRRLHRCARTRVWPQIYLVQLPKPHF